MALGVDVQCSYGPRPDRTKNDHPLLLCGRWGTLAGCVGEWRFSTKAALCRWGGSDGHDAPNGRTAAAVSPRVLDLLLCGLRRGWWQGARPRRAPDASAKLAALNSAGLDEGVTAPPVSAQLELPRGTFGGIRDRGSGTSAGVAGRRVSAGGLPAAGGGGCRDTACSRWRGWCGWSPTASERERRGRPDATRAPQPQRQYPPGGHRTTPVPLPAPPRRRRTSPPK